MPVLGPVWQIRPAKLVVTGFLLLAVLFPEDDIPCPHVQL